MKIEEMFLLQQKNPKQRQPIPIDIWAQMERKTNVISNVQHFQCLVSPLAKINERLYELYILKVSNDAIQVLQCAICILFSKINLSTIKKSIAILRIQFKSSLYILKKKKKHWNSFISLYIDSIKLNQVSKDHIFIT